MIVQPIKFLHCILELHRTLDLVEPSRGTPCDINEIYTRLKSTFNGLQFRR